MPADPLHALIDRALEDAEFRELLFTNPDTALAGEQLTDDQAAVLKGLARALFHRDQNGPVNVRRSLLRRFRYFSGLP